MFGEGGVQCSSSGGLVMAVGTRSGSTLGTVGFGLSLRVDFDQAQWPLSQLGPWA